VQNLLPNVVLVDEMVSNCLTLNFELASGFKDDKLGTKVALEEWEMQEGEGVDSEIMDRRVRLYSGRILAGDSRAPEITYIYKLTSRIPTTSDNHIVKLMQMCVCVSCVGVNEKYM
jgi:hypothetical protein